MLQPLSWLSSAGCFAVRLSCEGSHDVDHLAGIRIEQTDLCLSYVMGNGKGDTMFGIGKVSIYKYVCTSEYVCVHAHACGGCPPDTLGTPGTQFPIILIPFPGQLDLTCNPGLGHYSNSY